MTAHGYDAPVDGPVVTRENDGVSVRVIGGDDAPGGADLSRKVFA